QRWLTEKAAAEERAERTQEARRSEGMRQVQRWLDVIAEILDSGVASRIGILVHWYSGGIESERIDLGPTTSVSLDGLSADMLLEMKEDALLEVCARSTGGRPRLRDAAEAAVRRRVG